MRIESKPGIASIAAAQARRRSGAGGFALDEAPGAATAPRTSSVGPTTSLDAILALQSEEDPAERRRRATRRGQDLLDDLDRLKAAILTGRVAPDALKSLSGRLSERREATGDPRLDAVLDQIELRAEVEVAKLAGRKGRDAGA